MLHVKKSQLLLIALLLAAIGCGVRGLSPREAAAYDWNFRKQGFAVGTTTIIGGPNDEEIAYYMSMGVVTLNDLTCLGFTRDRPQKTEPPPELITAPIKFPSDP
jgi:hypothetical protein